MSENLTVRFENNLWTCTDKQHRVEHVGFIDLVIRIRNELGMRRFTLNFDCDGKAIDGASATFDFGAPDTYIPD